MCEQELVRTLGTGSEEEQVQLLVLRKTTHPTAELAVEEEIEQECDVSSKRRQWLQRRNREGWDFEVRGRRVLE
jgi:hypothetical protein